MNAREFYKEYITRVTPDRVVEDGRKLIDVYKNDAEFTPEVMKIINSIIESAGNGYKAQNEYYRVDAVGWVTKYRQMEEKAEKVKLNPHLWDLKIAVEHENSKRDWTDEVVKLIHIKCPLKVVIGYNYCNEREKKELDKLSFVASLMKKVKAFKNSKGEEYLIIIGNAVNSETKKSNYVDFDYRGYLYNKAKKRFDRIYMD